MSGDEIRGLEVSGEDLRACNIGHFTRVLGELEANGNAPLLRGKVFVGFPSLDEDPRANYIIPEVRTYLEALYEEFPHFFYYLVPDREFGVIAMHLMALLPEKHLLIQGYTAVPDLPDASFATFAVSRIRPAVDFCWKQGDDVDAFLDGIASNFPERVWTRIRSGVGK